MEEESPSQLSRCTPKDGEKQKKPAAKRVRGQFCSPESASSSAYHKVRKGGGSKEEAATAARLAKLQWYMHTPGAQALDLTVGAQCKEEEPASELDKEGGENKPASELDHEGGKDKEAEGCTHE